MHSCEKIWNHLYQTSQSKRADWGSVLHFRLQLVRLHRRARPDLRAALLLWEVWYVWSMVLLWTWVLHPELALPFWLTLSEINTRKHWTSESPALSYANITTHTCTYVSRAHAQTQRLPTCLHFTLPPRRHPRLIVRMLPCRKAVIVCVCVCVCVNVNVQIFECLSVSMFVCRLFCCW